MPGGAPAPGHRLAGPHRPPHARTQQQQDADQDGPQRGGVAVAQCHQNGGQGQEVGGVGVQASHAGQGVDDGGDGRHHRRRHDPLEESGRGRGSTEGGTTWCRSPPCLSLPSTWDTSVSARGWVAVGPADWAALTASIALRNPASSSSAAARAPSPGSARRRGAHLPLVGRRVLMPIS